MKKPLLPKTDSIRKLAEFWDTHDLTEFEEELEEASEPVFGRGRGDTIEVSLEARQVKTVEQMAQAKGVSPQQLVRDWVLQRIAPRKRGSSTKRSA